ncbi:MAG: hypothetical protein OXI77_08815 [Chloroflexota bacterium]|nr:hypothetical protein [Chloroflexota bacterium]MDE2909685.1 hypothetical protein [Chloroflexota bacterium]
MSRLALVIIIVLSLAAAGVSAGDGLNPAGDPRYGAHALAPGFAPAPFTHDALSGGDIAVKSLNLGDNCLGYAASDPDFLIELTSEFSRITFLIASEADTTLIVNLPNGSWACNDDTNGLNPALVFHSAPAGGYRLWIGSYAEETNDESVLTIAEAGPETLPTTATGPDPERDPLYGKTSLAPGFQPAPFTIQLTGGGRNPVADHVAGERCHGFVAEAPDFSIDLSDAFAEIWFAVFSPADTTLLVNAADGSWHCNDDHLAWNPGIGFKLPLAGRYNVWVGSAEEGNYAAAILYVAVNEPKDAADYVIDTSCDGLPESALQVGAAAVVAASLPSGVSAYTSPDTATTRIFLAPPGSALRLVGGPVCADAHRWWRADFGSGVFGWVAEGDASARWLEPQ